MMRRKGMAFIRCWRMSRFWWVRRWRFVDRPPNEKALPQPTHLNLGVPWAFVPNRVTFSGAGGAEAKAQASLVHRGRTGSRYADMRSSSSPMAKLLCMGAISPQSRHFRAGWPLPVATTV
jgi:hypothetical protein